LEKVIIFFTEGLSFLVGSWNRANEQSRYVTEMVVLLLLRILEHRNDRLLKEVLKGQK